MKLSGKGFPNNINDVNVFFPGNQLSILDSVPTVASLTATDVTTFVRRANLIPRGDRTYTVVLNDTFRNYSYGIIDLVRGIP